MSDITDVRCVLTQEALDAFCNMFHILEELHPVWPNQDDTMHERPAGKIRDSPPVTADFNAQDYATLVTHPSLFQKFSKAFLCLVGLSRHYTLDEETYSWFVHKNQEDMDLFAFIHALDPTKVRVVERERDKDEPQLLETTVGRTVPLLPIAPDHVETKLEASVNRLFYEGGSGHQTEQKDSAGGGQDANIQLVAEAADTIVEDAAPMQLRLYVPQWSVTNGSRLDDGRVCREMVDEFSPLKFFAFVRGVKHDQLFTEIIVGAARQMSLSAEVRMYVEYNDKEKRRLKYVVESQGELLKAREEEIGSLMVRLLLKEAEAAEAIRLLVEASNLETIENSLRHEANALRERNVILEKERDTLDVKVTELETSTMSKERELTDLNALVTFVKSQNDSLVDQVHEFEISSSMLQEKAWSNSTPTFLLLSLAAGGFLPMASNLPLLNGLAAGITHGNECRVLTDFTTHNPSAEVDYIFALQQLQNVNFPLLAELKSNKDASVEAIMEILRLEDPVAEKLRVQQIRKNIANHKLVLHDVFVSLAEPFSTSALTDADDQAVASEDADSFPNVGDAELHIPQ
nr:hypothetical protein [Tanacetum cinerariifolium]